MSAGREVAQSEQEVNEGDRKKRASQWDEPSSELKLMRLTNQNAQSNETGLAKS